MTHVFRSPKFHKDQRKELRMQYGAQKVISNSSENSKAASVHPGLRPKHQASSVEPQATSSTESQASSSKLQAPSTLEQVSSRKHQAP